MRFRATLKLNGKTATGFVVPEEVVTALGSSKRPAVVVTLNGYTYRSSIAPMGGRYLLGVSGDVRERAGVAAGDELAVDVQLDTEPRVVEVPADLASELAGDAAAKEFFESLSFSQQQWYVLPIESAKAAETRERRIAKAMDMLRERRKR
jgi:hypothetical protein